MTTQTEALKLALEALELCNGSATVEGVVIYTDLEITAIKEALAQPEHEKERCVGCEACIDTACGRDECPKGWPKATQPAQEPVAFIHGDDLDNLLDDRVAFVQRTKSGHRKTALYTTPPQHTWVELTDSEKYALADDVARRGVPVFEAICEAEAKLKEKNA